MPCDKTDNDMRVYLTFDDGPIPIITEQILDVLKEYNIKATFFVVGKQIPGRERILKRIYKEGHSIGLHTYSHKYTKQYYSDDALIKEMLKTREQIHGVLGISPSIIRFPGGSMNRLSGDLLAKLHSNNMRVFDWNVDIQDGKNGSTPVNKLVRNAETFKPGYTRNIILAHTNSTNINTVKALPEIIKYYKGLSYEFVPILDNTPEYYFKFKQPVHTNNKPN
ncbi:MAG: polysaccharide deacetylase family protein [Bacillota bacterium]|nr:polysaccharide deacetylase family protein [Bacillota bacterium]